MNLTLSTEVLYRSGPMTSVPGWVVGVGAVFVALMGLAIFATYRHEQKRRNSHH